MQDDRLKADTAPLASSESNKEIQKGFDSKKTKEVSSNSKGDKGNSSQEEGVIPKSVSRREKKKISYPLIYIHVGFSSNNTRLTATLPNGDCITWSTAGSSGFKGSKKATPHAANEAVVRFIEKMSKYNVKSAYIYFKGVSSSKDAITKALSNTFPTLKLIDITGYAFNGCTPPSRRAV